MAMTLNAYSSRFDMLGDRIHSGYLDYTFDDSYAFGGESIVEGLRKLGFKKIYNITAEPKNGFTFVPDIRNEKLKVFSPAPAIVYEEKQTAVANLITLDYPAAWIMNVCQAGQNMAWGKSQAAASLAANTFCVVGTIADGVRTQLYTDGATDVVYVTYITQAWDDLYKQLVQEEAVTLATGANNLANTMMAFGFCESATTGILLPVDIADTTATGEVGIKMGYATGALDINVGQNGEAAVVTYLEEPASGFLTDRYIEDEDPAKAGSDPYTQTFNRPLLVWCISGAATVLNGVTQVLIEEDATPAAGEANLNWGFRGAASTGATPAAGFVIGCKSNVIVTAGAYIHGHPWEILRLTQLEVKNATDLSALTNVRITITGTLKI